MFQTNTETYLVAALWKQLQCCNASKQTKTKHVIMWPLFFCWGCDVLNLYLNFAKKLPCLLITKLLLLCSR